MCPGGDGTEHHRGVDPAKREVVVENVPGRAVAHAAHIIHRRTVGIDVHQVPPADHELAAHHRDAPRGFDRTARAEGVTHEPLERGDGELGTEERRGGVALGDVADGRAGAVCTDVVDAGGFESRVFERQLHHPLHAFLARRGEVGAIAVAGVADELGEDHGATGAGVVERLEHERATAFSDHEPVTGRVEGTRALVRRVVELVRGRHEQVEGDRVHVVHLFGAAAEHDVLDAGADEFVAGPDPLRCAGARGAGARDAATHPEELRDVHRAGVRHQAEERVRLQSAHLVRRRHERPAERLGLAARPGGGSKRDAASFRGERCFRQARLLHRFVGRVHREHADPAHRAAFLPRVRVLEIEAFDRGTQTSLEVRKEVPFRHLPDAVPTRLERLHRARHVVADGRGRTDARDNDPAVAVDH